MPKRGAAVYRARVTWVKSFVDDLNEDRGIVSRRATSLLRSAEINPQIHDLFSSFCSFWFPAQTRSVLISPRWKARIAEKLTEALPVVIIPRK